LPDNFNHYALMDIVHERIEEDEIECGQCHAGMVKPPPGEEW